MKKTYFTSIIVFILLFFTYFFEIGIYIGPGPGNYEVWFVYAYLFNNLFLHLLTFILMFILLIYKVIRKSKFILVNVMIFIFSLYNLYNAIIYMDISFSVAPSVFLTIFSSILLLISIYFIVKENFIQKNKVEPEKRLYDNKVNINKEIEVTKEDVVFVITNYVQDRYNLICKLDELYSSKRKQKYYETMDLIDKMERKIESSVVGNDFEKINRLKEKFHKIGTNFTDSYFEKTIKIMEQKNDFRPHDKDESYMDYMERCYEKLQSYSLDKEKYYFNSIHMLWMLIGVYKMLYQELDGDIMVSKIID